MATSTPDGTDDGSRLLAEADPRRTATDAQEQIDLRDASMVREAHLWSVLSAIDQGYCVCELVFDDDGRPTDYRFLETNSLFEEMTGLQDALGRRAYELVPSLESHWLATYAEVALGGEPLRFQQASPAMGRLFDVFATPVEPRGRFALIFADVTERQAALDALQESEQRFRNMADHAPVTIWVTDADGGCTYINKRWYDFTGQAEPEAMGRGWIDATHPDDRGRTEATFADANRRRVAFSLDYRLRHTDGTYRWAVDAAAPRFDDEGRFLGFVGTVMDITERKAAEEAVTTQRDREHDIAVRLQESMLPSAPIEDERVEIATAYVASAEFMQVGGDWFETFHTLDGRIGIVVGDVVGHNIEAAAEMGQLRAGLLALTAHVSTPAELLCELDTFAQRHRITEFATALCLFLDPNDGAIEYSSAGHPAAILCPPDGSSRWLDDGRSLPLGVLPIGARPLAADVLEPGGIIVAYSDGLIERRRQAVDVGLDRLAEAVERGRSGTMEELCSQILVASGDDQGFEDDTVLVSLRRR